MRLLLGHLSYFCFNNKKNLTLNHCLFIFQLSINKTIDIKLSKMIIITKWLNKLKECKLL